MNLSAGVALRHVGIEVQGLVHLLVSQMYHPGCPKSCSV